jgi:uncharacterized protein YkwD
MLKSTISILGFIALSACVVGSTSSPTRINRTNPIPSDPVPTTDVLSGTIADETDTGDNLNDPIKDDDVSVVKPKPKPTPPDANFASLINGVRLGNGLGYVSHSTRLDKAAQAHAQDMVDNNYFSHRSLDGRTLQDRILAADYRAWVMGENIAQGHPSEEVVLKAWQNSPGHNAVLNGQYFEEFGLGIAGGNRKTWVLVMASDGDKPPR